MTTLNDVVSSVADQLARSDLDSQITREIGNAVVRFSRKLSYMTEVRGGLVILNKDQRWYPTFRLTDAAGLQETQGRGAVPFANVISFDYVRHASIDVLTALLTEDDLALLLEGDDEVALALESIPPNNQMNELCRLPIGEFEEWATFIAPSYLTGYAFYAGQFGCFPEHQGGAIYFSGHVKPLVPEVSTDTSVFFDQARELIEAAVCKAVSAKYIMDLERAAAFGALEAELLRDIQVETNTKATTGRIAPRW